MKFRERILWIILSLFFFLFPFLSFAAQKDRTVFVVWDSFVKLSNDGADHVTNVQTYLKTCIKNNVNPEEFYPVATVRELTIAEDEFRRSADTLHELRMRLEHPIPKGTMTAKK
jgi:hypothetical protein